MTTEEVFSKIAVHMIEGLMFHEQMANYYEFLGLYGYAECHEYHYLSESCSFHKINKYYVTHFNKLLPELKADDPEVIPNTWIKYTRNDVDTNTIRSSVKAGLEKWVKWETDTKKLYEAMYKELIMLDESAAALEVAKLVEDVSKELKHAMQYHLNKKAIDYDIVTIIDEQELKKKKYDIKILRDS